LLEVYFDGSGKDDDPQSRFLTIAGFAAEGCAWRYFEREWNKILLDRKAPDYMHMAEAIPHRKAFAGWDAPRTEFVIQGLIGLLMEVNQSKKFCGFRATVDLGAHKKYRSENNIPSVARLCANLALYRIWCWYSGFSDLILTPFEIVFDRGDPFLDVLMRQWNNREIRTDQPWWGLIRTIAPGEMKSTPPLQAADMLAWSHNRLKTFGASGWAGRIASQIVNSVECWLSDLGDDTLAGRKFPDANALYT
jgi:hypothetical protein